MSKYKKMKQLIADNAACGQLAGAYRDDQKQGERTMSARDVKSFGEEVEASC